MSDKVLQSFTVCPNCNYSKEMRKHAKNCNFCGRRVYVGTGTYYYLKLYHIWCRDLKRALKPTGKLGNLNG